MTGLAAVLTLVLTLHQNSTEALAIDTGMHESIATLAVAATQAKTHAKTRALPTGVGKGHEHASAGNSAKERDAQQAASTLQQARAGQVELQPPEPRPRQQSPATQAIGSALTLDDQMQQLQHQQAPPSFDQAHLQRADALDVHRNSNNNQADYNGSTQLFGGALPTAATVAALSAQSTASSLKQTAAGTTTAAVTRADKRWLSGAHGAGSRERRQDAGGVSVLATLTGHVGSVESVAFSPDSSLLASGSGDYNGGEVKLWKVSDRTLVATLSGHTRDVNSVAFSPDSSLLASGSNDNTVKLWKVSDRTLVATLTGYSDGVNSVAFSPDSSLLASGSDDNTIKLWKVSDRTLVATLTGHLESVFSVAFSPDSSLLASGSGDDTVRLWRVSDRTLVATGLTERWVRSVAFSPDSSLLATGASWDDKVTLWGLGACQKDDTCPIHSSCTRTFRVDFHEMCVCNAGYTGASCETNINECQDQTCSNHGSCVDGIAKYTCECENGYIGSNCQYSNAKTCNGVGVVDSAGKCTCDGPTAGIGSNCQYSNAKTCSGVGTVFADGRCFCDDPSIGAGSCNCIDSSKCTFNREKTCSNHGNATSRIDSDCDCDLGYAGASCNDCDDRGFTRYDLSDGLFTCKLNDGVAKCELGQFSQDGLCVGCPKDTYANGKRQGDDSADGGYRVACRQCPDGETSRQDGTGCFQTYQLSTSSGSLFCSGTGSDVSQSALSRIDNILTGGVISRTAVQACNDAADALKKTFLDPSTFAKSAACRSDKASNQGSSAECLKAKDDNLCDLDTKVQIDGIVDFAVETCRFTCGTCWNKDAKGGTPFPFGCVLDSVSDKVTYYSEEDALKYYNGDPYTPVCERRTCPGEANVPVEVTDSELMLNPQKKPVCKRGEQELKDLAAAESARNNKTFFPIAVPLVVVVMLIATYIAGDRSEGRQTAKFVFFGVGLRAFDFMTDWATYAININGEVFAAEFGDGDVETEDANVDLVRRVCLAFCIVGSVLTPYDIWGALQRKNKRYPAAMAIGIAILLFEDFPQLSVNIIYISAVGADPLAAISFVASLGGIFYNVYVLIQDCRGGEKPSLRAMLGCPKQANAAGDEIEMEEVRRNTMGMVGNPMHAPRAAAANEPNQLAQKVTNVAKVNTKNQQLFLAKARSVVNASARGVAEHENEQLKAELAEMKRKEAKRKEKRKEKKVVAPKEKTKHQKTTAHAGVAMADVKGFSVSAVGKQCTVVSSKVEFSGIIRFVGLHAIKNEPRIGVEMNKPKGKNNGTVAGHTYFECSEGHGLLTDPSNVTIVAAKTGGKASGYVAKCNIQSKHFRFAATDVGQPCTVTGFGSGTIRFVGFHAEKNEPRVGVQLNKPKGKNNGTVNGHKYFKCKDGYGLLTQPEKIKLTAAGVTGKHAEAGEYLDVDGVESGPNRGSHA